MAPNGITITSIVTQQAGLNIVNSQGEVHADTQQVLWTSDQSFLDDHENKSNGTTVNGSLRPASYELNTWFQITMNVVVDAQSPYIGHELQLQGSISGWDYPVASQLAERLTPNNAGPYSVTLFCGYGSYLPTQPWGLAGDIAWSFYDWSGPVPTPTPSTAIGSTRLELYGLTSQLTPLYNNRVDVRFLRAFVLPATLTNTFKD